MNIKPFRFSISSSVYFGKLCWLRNQYTISKLSNFTSMKLFITFPCYLFNRCRTHTGISFIIPDSGYSCLLFSFLVSLARSLSNLKIFLQCPLLALLVFIVMLTFSILLIPTLYYFFPFIYSGFKLLIFSQLLAVVI